MTGRECACALLALLSPAACSKSNSAASIDAGGRDASASDATSARTSDATVSPSDARTPDAKHTLDVASSDAASPPDSAGRDGASGDGDPLDANTDAPTSKEAGPPRCTSASQCDAGACVDGGCAAVSCTSAVQNGNETDVGCGGGICPPCPATDKCLVNSDCISGGCDYTFHCALARSCTQHHGGDTCGTGEDTDLGSNPTPATGEESCCTSIAIPGTGLTVDKYLITAGRIRAWVTSLGGNIRAFTSSIPASNTNWNSAWNQYMPTTTNEVDLQLGPYPAPLTPSPYPPTDTVLNEAGEPTGNWLGQWRDGCSMGAEGAPSGARTWWTNYAIGSDQAPIVYPQDYLDDKIINCIDSYMLTAFCIWDGGHLVTDAELAAAWGAGPFPWSAAAPMVLIDQTTQEPVGMDSSGRTASSYVAHEFGLTPQEFVAPFTYDYDPYGLFADDSIHIPPPGRFPLGAGPYGHMDLAGAAYEATSVEPGTFTTEPPPEPPTVVTQVDHNGTLEGGSWEIHPIISGAGPNVIYDPWMPAYWAYWAMTSRCGR